MTCIRSIAEMAGLLSFPGIYVPPEQKSPEETVPGRLSCFSGIILQGKVYNAVIDGSYLEIRKVNFRERSATGVYFLKFEFGMDIL